MPTPENTAKQATEHAEIARIMADHYDPEISLSDRRIPPKVYDEIIGRAWQHDERDDKAGAAVLRAAVNARDIEDRRF